MPDLLLCTAVPPGLQAAYARLLTGAGLRLEEAGECTALLLADDGALLACGTRSGKVLRQIAVSPEAEGGGACAEVVSALLQDATAHGVPHPFLFTAPGKSGLFRSLGFTPLAQTADMLMMEHGRGGLRRFLSGIPVGPERPVGILAKELMGKDVSHLLVNQIISHHTGLHDFGDVENILKERLLSKEINEGDISINKPLLFQEFIDSPFSKSKVEWKHFHHLSRMLFSCLVDADRLDTERFMDVESWRKRGNSATLADLLPQLEAYMQKLQSNAADTKVNRIRQQVKEQCSRTSSSEKGFYSLTVPTGGGKTLSSLLWAMKHAVSHSMNRIIIAIPYTSIIVQTAGLLKEIFGEENVLEHHSNFDPDDIKDEENREKAKLATENWDYPIIVTTNVQLFESMFSNKTSDCRKLHNMANSILVLDEVQMLPTGFLRPIVDALKAYQEMFGVSVLFTTASQPVLSGLIEGTNPKADFKGIEHIKEIIPEEFVG